MNKNINKANRLVIGLIAGLLFLSSVVAFANNGGSFSLATARPQINVTLSGMIERDKEKLQLDKVEAVKPGEILHWTINSENKGDGEAKEYKAVGKIPAGTVFVAKSAKAEGAAAITYSIDGGKTFSAQPMIEEKQADGSVKLVPAPESMYSQVRFEWEAPLNPNEKLNAFYDVKVK
jgi:uncharacterized repeat protein (TIGR01451 family)